MSRNNILISILILIVLVIGAFYIYRESENSKASVYNADNVPIRNEEAGPSTAIEATSTKTSTIIYTNNGFSPKVMTISKGQTVVFDNQSSSRMWVASNPHPAHSDYPEFDENTSVPRGGQYSFTFTKKGTWGYHNHMKTSETGTVIVK